MSPCIHLLSHKTPKYFVIGLQGEEKYVKSTPAVLKPANYKNSNGNAANIRTPSTSTRKKTSVFLDINEPYTRNTIHRALTCDPLCAPYFSVELGPGDGEEAVPIPSDCDFQWSEYERIDWKEVLRGKHGAASYCVRKGISRKAQLSTFTHRYICKHPNSLLKDCLPQTFVLDTWSVWEDDDVFQPKDGLSDIVIASASGGGGGMGDGSINQRRRLDKCLEMARSAMKQAEQEFIDSVSHNDETVDPPTWILKPSTANKAAGIQILHVYEQLVDECWSEPDIREWVLQRYISSPLLLRKRKFHIRAYVLAVSAIRVYLNRGYLALSAGTRYRKTDTSDYKSHLTNTAFQDCADPNFDERKCIFSWSESDIIPLLLRDGTCRTQEEAMDKISKVNFDMENITAELFRAYENEFSVFAPLENCFEHFGFDFMVDDQWKVYLLEVNPGPDFKQTGKRLRGIVDRLMVDTVRAALLLKDGRDGSQQTAESTVGNLVLVYEKRKAVGRKSSNRQTGDWGLTLTD